MSRSPNFGDDFQFIRLPEVKTITALSKSTIYELIRDGRFLRPFISARGQ